jgi:hypothetical protein
MEMNMVNPFIANTINDSYIHGNAQTNSNSMMVGFVVKPDNKYLDNMRVNRINNLLTTFQMASCDLAFQNAYNWTDNVFDTQASFQELDCDDVLRRSKKIYDNVLSTDDSSKQLLIPTLALGYGLFTDMVRDTCGQNKKLTRESVIDATNALLKVACNVDQSSRLGVTLKATPCQGLTDDDLRCTGFAANGLCNASYTDAATWMTANCKLSCCKLGVSK